MEIVDELEFCDKEVTAITHIHKLTKVPMVENFICRGTSLFNDISTCKNITQEKSKFMYHCLTCKGGKNKNGEVYYCGTCARKQDKEFKVKDHEHDLLVHSVKTGWTCSGKNLKDGCKSNNQTNNTLRFKCDKCEYNNCEYCLVYYH